MTYINGKFDGQTETVDEFTTRREAREAIKEYRLAFGAGWNLWLSRRCCKSWTK